MVYVDNLSALSVCYEMENVENSCPSRKNVCPSFLDLLLISVGLGVILHFTQCKLKFPCEIYSQSRSL